MLDYQCITEVTVASSRLPEFVVAGPPYVRLPLTCQIALEHCQCHIGFANYGNMWHGSKSLVSHSIVFVMWHSTAELTPLRSVRPSYRFLRPRSRENLSPAGTSHFPRPWVGHVRRTAPSGRRHADHVRVKK